MLQHIQSGLKQKDDPCISEIERFMALFVGQVVTKSRNLQNFKSQYLSEFLSYRPDFLHVIINFKGFHITFSNMNMESYNTPFISKFVYANFWWL